MVDNVPSLPPGFVLEGETPPPPTGFVIETPAAQPVAQIPTAAPTQEPKSFFGGLLSDIGEGASSLFLGTGRTEFEDLPEFGSALTTANAPEGTDFARLAVMPVTTSDASRQADIIRKAVPGAQFRRDKFDNILVQFEGRDGETVTTYLNKPGFSPQDIPNIGGDFVSFLPAGKAAITGQTFGARALRGGAAAATTEAARQQLSRQLGADEQINLPEVGIVGLFGGGAEVISPLVSRIGRQFRKSPKLFDRQTGTLTDKGREFVKRFNINPDDVTEEVAKGFERRAAMARKLAPEDVGRIEAEPFGITELTRGQALGEPGQRSLEERIARGLRGERAQRIFQAGEERLQEQLKASPDVVQKLLGAGDDVFETTFEAAGVVGEGVKNKARELKSAVDDAYSSLSGKDARLTFDSFQDLRKSIVSGLRADKRVIDRTVTPKTVQAFDRLNNIAKRLTSGQQFKKISLEALERERRALRELAKQAAPGGEDQANIYAILGSMDDWLDEAVTKGLLQGDQNLLNEIKGARAANTLYRTFFPKAKGKDAAKSEAAKALRQIVDYDANPEQIANYILGRSKLGGKLTSTETVKLLDKLFEPGSVESTAIRQMSFLHMVKAAKRGDRIAPNRLASEIDKLFNEAPTLAKELFNDEQANILKKYSRTLKRIGTPSVNPSGSAFENERTLQSLGRQITTALGLASGNPYAAIALAGVDRAPGFIAGAKAAGQARQLRVPLAAPQVSPFVGAAGATLGAQQGGQE